MGWPGCLAFSSQPVPQQNFGPIPRAPHPQIRWEQTLAPTQITFSGGQGPEANWAPDRFQPVPLTTDPVPVSSSDHSGVSRFPRRRLSPNRQLFGTRLRGRAFVRGVGAQAADRCLHVLIQLGHDLWSRPVRQHVEWVEVRMCCLDVFEVNERKLPQETILQGDHSDKHRFRDILCLTKVSLWREKL